MMIADGRVSGTDRRPAAGKDSRHGGRNATQQAEHDTNHARTEAPRCQTPREPREAEDVDLAATHGRQRRRASRR